ncbi:MAG: response regulator, partial [Planctomycetaceae bacterium]
MGEVSVPTSFADGRRFWFGLLLVILVCLMPAAWRMCCWFFEWPLTAVPAVTTTWETVWQAQFVATLFEWTVCCVALFTGLLAVMNRDLWDDAETLVLGLAVACGGGLHVLRVLIEFGWATTPNPLPLMFNESWSVCRLATASLLVTTLLLMVLRRKRDLWLDNCVVLVTTCGFGAVLLMVTQGSRTVPLALGDWVGRPAELLTLVPYSMAGLLLFPVWRAVKWSSFVAALWLSTIPQIAVQFHLACAIGQPFGWHDQVASALALFAQCLPLIGLCHVYMQTLREQRNAVRELERSERELERIESRTRQMIETAMDAVVTLDEHGRIIRWNQQAVEVFGLFPAQARGRQLTEFVSAGDQLQKLRRMQQEVSTGSGAFVNQRTEVMARRADGLVFPVEVSMKSVASHGETVYCAFVRDITQRVHAESELREAKQQAEAANRAKTEFLANMSHEVRTPMTAVLGCTDLLFEPGLTGKVRREALDAIRRNGRHLLQLLDDILDLSKIEAGKIDIANVMMSPWSTVAEVVSLYRLRAEERGLTLLAVPVGLLPRLIRCDRRRLRQILVNFVSNAIKFTDQGQVEVRVMMQDTDSGAPSRIRFDVVDDGVGMNAEMLARIFSPFEQADTSTTRRHGGSGLGLAICNRLASAMDGEILVDSRPSQGSCFSLLLPAVDAGPLLRIDPLTSSLSRSEDSTDGLREMHCYRGRALLVEDMPDNRKVLKFYLEAAGLSVDTMDNGRQGVQQALQDEYDLVLMDMQMPELDGYEAARRLRAAGYRQPIIALTAHAMASDRERCIRAGCSDYITKPVEYQRLLSVIGNYCERTESPELDRAEMKPAQIDSTAQELVTEYVAGLPDRVQSLQA